MLVSELPSFDNGEIRVELLLPDRKPGNAGLIVRLGNPGVGANNFDGYEVSLDAAAQIVRLGRHCHDWQLIQDVPCEVPVDRWIPLAVRLRGSAIEVLVDGRQLIQHDDGSAAILTGTVGLRQWQREARYRQLEVRAGQQERQLAFERPADEGGEISGMWRLVRRGAAVGVCSLDRHQPLLGSQSQRLTLTGGEGALGVENQGLGREGMFFVGGQPYEGVLWARTDEPTSVWVALESHDGAQVHAEQQLAVAAGDWQRLEFTLIPSSPETKSRFAITLRKPGSIVLGHAFLQPGAAGRFAGLPVRRDVAEALQDQGITVLRYGGSMINHPEYRWKRMIGPRDRRPPYSGTWYPYSSNGWGIVDFLNVCEAAGFLAIPAFNMGETPQDMADFMQYVNGPAESPWGRRRVADGHPQTYALRYLELGNEERVDEAYAEKFEALAKAIWAADPDITLVVGDFVYGQRIDDPQQFQGAAAGITNLAGQRRILQLAKKYNREVWFDLHVGTDGPRPDGSFDGMFSFLDALAAVSEGARHRVVVFEFNAGNHSHRRALANALAIQAIERDGRIPVATSANCLQPDGHNDNGWDQGLLFLNPSQVWLQPPGWVTRMISRNYQPLHIPASVAGAPDLDVSARRSEDGRTLVLQVVNVADHRQTARIHLQGFQPSKSTALVEELAGSLDAQLGRGEDAYCTAIGIVGACRHPRTTCPVIPRILVHRDSL